MTDKPRYGSPHSDSDWGCDYFEIEPATSIGKIKVSTTEKIKFREKKFWCEKG